MWSGALIALAACSFFAAGAATRDSDATSKRCAVEMDNLLRQAKILRKDAAAAGAKAPPAVRAALDTRFDALDRSVRLAVFRVTDEALMTSETSILGCVAFGICALVGGLVLASAEIRSALNLRRAKTAPPP